MTGRLRVWYAEFFLNPQHILAVIYQAFHDFEGLN